MGKNDWIPGREQDVADLCAKWIDVLSSPANITAYGWDAVECSNVLEHINIFVDSRTEFAADNSSPKRLTKDNAKRGAIRSMRDFANSSVRYNRKMDDTARLALGIRPRDVTRTPTGDPVGQAEADISYPARTQLMLQIRHVAGTPVDLRANYGYRIHYGVYDAGHTPPPTGKDLRESRFTRQKREIFTFEQEDAGKTAYFCIRYENSRGKAGVWGPVFSAVIP